MESISAKCADDDDDDCGTEMESVYIVIFALYIYTKMLYIYMCVCVCVYNKYRGLEKMMITPEGNWRAGDEGLTGTSSSLVVSMCSIWGMMCFFRGKSFAQTRWNAQIGKNETS